jgi:ABC-type nitrate/sulfonate/bicarbonate transport system permease component
MDLTFLKTLSPRALKFAIVAAVTTIAVGLGFRTWRPEAALQTPDYVVVFIVCLGLAYAASRILRRGRDPSKPADAKAPPSADK